MCITLNFDNENREECNEERVSIIVAVRNYKHSRGSEAARTCGCIGSVEEVFTAALIQFKSPWRLITPLQVEVSIQWRSQSEESEGKCFGQYFQRCHSIINMMDNLSAAVGLLTQAAQTAVMGEALLKAFLLRFAALSLVERLTTVFRRIRRAEGNKSFMWARKVFTSEIVHSVFSFVNPGGASVKWRERG